MNSIVGTITEVNRTADRIALVLSNGLFAVCRLLERQCRLPLGEKVIGQIAESGASMLTTLGSRQKLRALVLGVYPSKAAALEMVYD